MSSTTFLNNLHRRRKINLGVIQVAPNDIPAQLNQPSLINNSPQDTSGRIISSQHRWILSQPQPVCILECGALIIAKLDEMFPYLYIFDDTLRNLREAHDLRSPIHPDMPVPSHLTPAGYLSFGAECVDLTITMTHVRQVAGDRPSPRPFMVISRRPDDHSNVGLIIGKNYLAAFDFAAQLRPMQSNTSDFFGGPHNQQIIGGGLNAESSSVPDFALAHLSPYSMSGLFGGQVGDPSVPSFVYSDTSYSHAALTSTEGYMSPEIQFDEV
ncbi:hypothetical protein F5B18DRAFT_28287 [Nemania serpens]|nr:hypothetical protein F5B18DRAFT_28287 [Nemania serpens]